MYTCKSIKAVLIILLCLLSNSAHGKDAKNKIDKYIFYKGEVVDKKPQGLGTLSIYSRVNKKDPIFELKGKFDTQSNKLIIYSVKDAELIVNNGLKFLAPELTTSIELEKDVQLVDLNMSDCSITNSSLAINNIESITLSLKWNKVYSKDWICKVEYSNMGNIDSALPSTYDEIFNSHHVKPVKQKVDYKIIQNTDACQLPNNVIMNRVLESEFDSGLIVKHGNSVEYIYPDGIITMSPECVIKLNDGIVFTGSIQNSDDIFSYKLASDAIINSGKLSRSPNVWDIYENGVITGGQWPLSDGGYVEYANNEPVNVKYPDGSIVENGIFGKDQSYNPAMKSTDYKIMGGTKIMTNGIKIKYINGESELDIRYRLYKKKVAPFLIDRVILGQISEANAIKEQKLRDDFNTQQLKVVNEILKSKWNCKEIMFSGPIQGTKEGDEVLAMLFNLDHTYIDGEVALALQSDGEGAFAVVAVPSKKAGNLSRPKAMQLLDACEKISEHITGRWSIQGNDIQINGKKVATLSSDNKTVKYEGMVGAIMKITIKK